LRERKTNNGVIDLKRKRGMGKTCLEKVVFGVILTIPMP